MKPGSLLQSTLVICFVLGAALTSDCNSWTPIKHNVMIPWDLETTPLEVLVYNNSMEIKDYHKFRFGAVFIEMYDDQEQFAGAIQLGYWPDNINPRPTKAFYRIRTCHKDLQQLPAVLPVGVDKIITFYRTKEGIKLECNGKLILDFHLSEATCYYKYTEAWQKQWSKDVAKIMFHDYRPHWNMLSDQASDGYRAKVTGIDGGWTAFSAWSQCSAECGGGTQSRSRSCTNPRPSNGGAECSGDAEESQRCNTDPCTVEVDGGWSNYSEWSDCNKECGGGYRLRDRTCSKPSPSKNGKPCAGPNHDFQNCNEQSCSAMEKCKHLKGIKYRRCMRNNSI